MWHMATNEKLGNARALRLTPSQSALQVQSSIYRLLDEHPGMTKADVRKATGLASSTFYDKLQNRPQFFNLAELGAIATAFDVTVSSLLRGE